jgi:hypothetical protein
MCWRQMPLQRSIESLEPCAIDQSSALNWRSPVDGRGSCCRMQRGALGPTATGVKSSIENRDSASAPICDVGRGPNWQLSPFTEPARLTRPQTNGNVAIVQLSRETNCPGALGLEGQVLSGLPCGTHGSGGFFAKLCLWSRDGLLHCSKAGPKPTNGAPAAQPPWLKPTFAPQIACPGGRGEPTTAARKRVSQWPRASSPGTDWMLLSLRPR